MSDRILYDGSEMVTFESDINHDRSGHGTLVELVSGSEESDIEYFKQNLYRSLGIPKHMLDDALVVYHETRPPEGEYAN